MNSVVLRSPNVRRKNGERGSALLIVLVFAAIIAISLYKELPIVAFETQRQKEQLLIDRGGEYARGVKLYVRKVGQYPPSFEAMENTNRMRFLRKRYKDPFTGKDDWRLLHAGPGGMILDSKVKPMSNPNGANGTNPLGSANGNSPGNTGFSSANANAGFGGVNAAGSGNSNFGGAFSSGQTANANNNNGMQPNTGNGNAGFGGFNSANTGNNSNRSFGGYLSPGGVSADPETTRAPSGVAMRQRAAAIAANGAAGGTPASILDVNNGDSSLTPTALGQNPTISNNGDPNGPQAGPGVQLTAGQNPGVNTGINPNGNQGFNPASPMGGNGQQGSPFGNNRTSATGNNQAGFGSSTSSSSGMGVLQSGGIAGVASKALGASIKSVNDQERYTLWEFVYDATKDANRQMASALSQTGAGANPVGNTGFSGSGFGQGAGNGTGAQGSPFGNSQPGSGQSSPFGNSQNNGFGNSNNNGFGNSNNNGFGNSSNNGFGNSNNGFGNSTNTNSNGFNNSQGMPPPAIVRP